MAEWIDFEGKKILFFNCKGFHVEAFLRELDVLEREYEKAGTAGGKNRLLVLFDITDTDHTNDAVKNRLEEIAKKGKAAGIAFVGVTGIKRIIAGAIRPDAYFGKTLAAAKEWLVKRID